MILEKIRQVYPELTQSQKELADFIAHSYRQAAFMTASRLAKALDLNEATVIRFAQRLGYSGYPDLIQDVQNLVQEELTYVPSDEQHLRDPFGKILASQIENVQHVGSHLSSDLTSEAIRILDQAEHVHVLGQGLSAPLAQLLSYSLRNIGMLADSPQADIQGLAMVASKAKSSSVLVSISATNRGDEVANVLRFARSKGVPSIAIACSPISECAQAADVALVCSSPAELPLPSITALAIVIDTLVQTLGTLNAETVSLYQADIDQAREFIASTHRR